MASTKDTNGNGEIEVSNSKEGEAQSAFHFSTSQKTLLNDEVTQRRSPVSITVVAPIKRRFFKFGSASARFLQIAKDRDEVSRSVHSSSSHHFRERLNEVFSKKIDWASLLNMSKTWIRDPMNMALFIWITGVAVSGAILFLVMTGMLNGALPKKSQRDVWFEVNNQILNALFTLMCLYQHPKRIHHLILLSRWKPEDVARLRKLYCKDGTYKPHEWAHMMVVIILLNVNCFAQYALCGLNLGYRRPQRPAIGVGICISVAIAAPAIAGIYSIISPLGKDYDSELDEEAQLQNQTVVGNQQERSRLKSLEKKYSFATRDEHRIIENRPQWSGGILDFWDDISLAYLSLFCSFCVFGWNMERLGFGNMYVHIVTFILFCMAPFWIFLLAAVNIDNGTVRTIMAIAGIILCVFGLLYGGFWRIRMRKRYNLPAYNFCFGKPAVADCSLWLFCCWCTLAQEARTGNSYDIVQEKFCRKQAETDESNEALGEDDKSGARSPLANASSPSKIITGDSLTLNSTGYYSPERLLASVKEELAEGTDKTMAPPSPSLIQRGAT
ncbi:uncharacterized protein LOC111021340 [Momordica charantia]|uniref:Uncharacterized protein LOC111021340 n=1 Tax=Momordica charantia TaxID=3673 RepID=A0A6J1DKL8_MOMCH|nr:uncharacterized protein LOC111021340 [Momordica charantia]XP_022153954.1 uncharacterized protein LOC111021340 [Momordica charantia]